MLYSVELQGRFPSFGNANIRNTFLYANNIVLPLKKILTLRHHDYFYRMKNYAVIALALLLLSTPVFAQETAGQTTTPPSQGKTFQPDVRGSLLFAVGVNGLAKVPEQFELSNFRSKSVHIYYLYDINLGSSRFSFHPGIGLGLEKYELKNPVTLNYRLINGSATEVLVLDSLQFVYGSGSFKKNRIAANYVDVPLEFSWVSNKTNPKGGFKVALGGKVGVLYGAHTKVKYTVGEDTRKDKLKRDWNLNPFRYSAHARVGYSSFNLYFEYQLSQLFDPGDGPLYRTSRNAGGTLAPFQQFPTNVVNWRAGIAINLF